MQRLAKETEKEELEPWEEIRVSMRTWKTTGNQPNNKEKGDSRKRKLSFAISPQDLLITSLGKWATVFYQSCLPAYNKEYDRPALITSFSGRNL